MLNRLRNYWSIFTSHFSDPQKRKLLAIIAIMAVVLAIPLTVFIAQKQQELRQRASEFKTTPPFLTLPFATESFPSSPPIIFCNTPFIIEAYGLNDNNEAQLSWGTPESANQVEIEWRRLASKVEWQSGASASAAAIKNLWNLVQPMSRVATAVGRKKTFVIPDLDKNYAYGVRIRVKEYERTICKNPSDWTPILTFTTF